MREQRDDHAVHSVQSWPDVVRDRRVCLEPHGERGKHDQPGDRVAESMILRDDLAECGERAGVDRHVFGYSIRHGREVYESPGRCCGLNSTLMSMGLWGEQIDVPRCRCSMGTTWRLLAATHRRLASTGTARLTGGISASTWVCLPTCPSGPPRGALMGLRCTVGCSVGCQAMRWGVAPEGLDCFLVSDLHPHRFCMLAQCQDHGVHQVCSIGTQHIDRSRDRRVPRGTEVGKSTADAGCAEDLLTRCQIRADSEAVSKMPG